MKNPTLYILFAVAFLATSCVSNFQVSAEYDKEVDFKKYKTYSFLPYEPGRNANIGQAAQDIIFNSIKDEMNKRGYTLVEKDGDLTVGLSVLIEEKVEFRSDGSVNYNVGYGYYGYYGGYGMGYSSPTTYREYTYNDGTLVIDVFDRKTKNLVWQGYGFDRLDDNPHREAQKIPTYVKYIFYKYPVRPSRK